MIRTFALAACLAAAWSLPAQQPTPELHLPMSSRSLGFHVENFGPFDVTGDAHGREGLDYSAGVSVNIPHDLPVLHRVILDRTHHVYFGYDLTILPGDDSAHVRLHFAPLSDLRGFHFDVGAFQPAEMATPADRPARLKDAIEVALEQDDTGRVQLRDTLHLRSH